MFCRARLLICLFAPWSTFLADVGDFTVVPERLSSGQNTLARAKGTVTPWLFLIYMAADNNLHYFAWSNIKQMAALGSNDNVKIVVQLNEPGANTVTQQYLIEKNRAVSLNPATDDNPGKKLNSGDPKTLVDFCTKMIDRFPAQHVALIFWDHGTGCLEPSRARMPCVNELFRLNPENMMLELNRADSFFDRVDCDARGVCFDDTFHSYLSNARLAGALQEICKHAGSQIDIIGFDACLMQMLEVGALMYPYAHIMVGSQEVELGAGWNYKYVLAPFADKVPSPSELALNIVASYEKVYSKITNDYTLSAVNLDEFPTLIPAMDTVGDLLLTCLTQQTNKSVKSVLKQSRSRKSCVCFDEPSYVDLGNLCKNILANAGNFNIANDLAQKTKVALQAVLDEITTRVILGNTVGKNLARATGLSVYFPESRLHTSYANSLFATNNKWGHLVKQYLAS